MSAEECLEEIAMQLAALVERLDTLIGLVALMDDPR
jgi:hypothetical protein